MRSCSCRPWLMLAALIGAASCAINPQPPLPGRGGDDASETPGTGGKGPLGIDTGGGGGLAPTPGTGGTSSPVIGAGGEPIDMGAGAGGDEATGHGGQGAGGESGAGGAGGAVGAAEPR